MPARALLEAGISFVLILVLDVSGVIYGVGKMAKLLKVQRMPNGQERTIVEGAHWALIAASVGTILASLTGATLPTFTETYKRTNVQTYKPQGAHQSSCTPSRWQAWPWAGARVSPPW